MSHVSQDLTLFRVGVTDIDEMSEQARLQLPAIYHRPYFSGLGKPATWCCEVCWGDGWTTAWPCDKAVEGGVGLAKSLGVGWSW